MRTTLLIILSLITYLSIGQTMKFDSCGIDLNPELNKFEILYLDSVFFAPYEINGELHNFTNGFNFHDKKLAFYDCGEIENNGYLTKMEFFKKLCLNIMDHMD
ncbi:MAG: hypothetical protein HC905_09575 [Bacteroidales bacterium]|nr:hypothetical protein [Bacteroidales bacterium]